NMKRYIYDNGYDSDSVIQDLENYIEFNQHTSNLYNFCSDRSGWRPDHLPKTSQARILRAHQAWRAFHDQKAFAAFHNGAFPVQPYQTVQPTLLRFPMKAAL
ncbi:MAG: hypothetical protein SXU28_07835, partial [Pseudomonadota bacterium]|nr:hypothetical protein [Pseudomonadota bacterium]